MKFEIIFILFTFFNGFYLNAQIENILWQNCLGVEDGKNWIYTVEKSENGYLFGINIRENGPGVTNFHGASDAWIVKTDFFGNIIWEKCFGGSEGDGSHKIIKIDNTTYYLLNASWSSDGDVLNVRDGNFWIVKIDSDGNIIWENSYGGCLMGDEVCDAVLMPDKGLLMMGRISSTGGDITNYYGDMDIWLCRIDSTGNILWQKTIGNEGADNGLKIKLTTGNTILFVGSHELTGGMIDCPDLGYYIYIDAWIVELDLEGNIINQWCYGGKYPDQGSDIIEVQDGYIIAASTVSNDRDVSGLHGTPGGDFYDIWAFKIDRTGNLIWQICLGGNSSEFPVFLTNTEDGGIIIIGNTSSLDGDVTGNHSMYDYYSDIWIVKLNSIGELEWEHCFGGLGTERFWGTNSVLKIGDYNYVIGANSNYLDQDVECDLFPNNVIDYNAWLLEIKDCNYYAPGVPVNLIGPDTLCSIADPASSFSYLSSQWATGYEWDFEPDNAGIITYNDTTALITWNQQFEGAVNVFARSYNDCGYSAWSEPFVTQVYSCLGVDEQGGGEAGKQGCLEIFPNPASGIVDFRWSMADFRGEVELEIYDIFGRTASATHISLPRLGEGWGGGTGGWTVDVSSLPPGIYLAVVRDGTRIVGSGKFLVVR